jgi:iron-sulfur cluster repair protein YtfE (RIC family)
MSDAISEQTERVLQEHRELNQMVADLRAFLQQPRPKIGEKDSHPWAADLSERLVKLHSKLALHFRYEEEEGVVEEISFRFPRASRKIEELVSQHPQILAEVRDLMGSTLAYSEGQEPARPALRKRLNALLDLLDQHEQSETELIQQLEYEDLGDSD